MKKLSTFSFALLALCFALSCSSSTSHVIKSKSSPRARPYEKVAMRELRKELARRSKEGFPNILKGHSGTYVYDTKKQEYVLGKKAPSQAEQRALAAQKPSSSTHHHNKAKSKSYKKTAMRELRNKLARRSREGFPDLLEGPSGPYVWNTKKQEYLLDHYLLKRRKIGGLKQEWNRNKYVLRGSLSRAPALASKPTPLTPSTPSIEAKPLASKTPSPPTPSIEPRPLASKKPSPPASIEAPQPRTRITVPTTKPLQAARPAAIPTKPPQTATRAAVPTKPSQAVASAPALPKTTASQTTASQATASQAKAKPIARKKKRSRRARVKRHLSKEDAAILLYKIDKALKEHSKEDTDVRDFLVRAYRRYYRKDKLSVEDARRIMGLGLAYRGSLQAIMRCMKRQYPEVHMRHYAFSKIFKMTRHEAKKVFAVYGGNGS